MDSPIELTAGFVIRVLTTDIADSERGDQFQTLQKLFVEISDENNNIKKIIIIKIVSHSLATIR